MRYFTTSIVLFISFITLLSAQQNWQCVHPAENTSRLESHLRHLIHPPRTDTYIPVVFHLVGDDDGNISISHGDLYDAICITNIHFEESGMQYYVLDIEATIHNTALQTDPWEHTSTMIPYLHPQALNVFVVDFDIPLAYMASTLLGVDIIVIDREVADGDNFSLAHEFGHFFGLNHTYTGWDSVSPFNFESYYDITGQTPASATTDIGAEAELVDGSNCATTADMICDTPPDYFFGAIFPQCEQNINVLDANGDLIPWEPGNVMSAFLNCPIESYFFSEQQRAVMFTDFMSPERDYLRELPQPTITEQGLSSVNLLTPEDDSGVDCDVLFSWEDAGDDVQYLFELSTFPLFSLGIDTSIITNSSQILLHTSDYRFYDNETYYWHVKPLFLGSNCSGSSFSSTFSFIYPWDCYPPNAAEDLQLKLDWSVNPNPVKAGQQWQIHAEVDDTQALGLSVHSVDGKLLFENKIQLLSGSNTIQPVLPNLPAGVYFAKLNDGRRYAVKKVVVF